MRLPRQLLRVPFAFAPGPLVAEVDALPVSSWINDPRIDEPRIDKPRIDKPRGAAGSVLPLVAAGGDPASIAAIGDMQPTPLFDRCPLLRDLLARLDTPIGRTLLRRNGDAGTQLQSNAAAYWIRHLRLCLPVASAAAGQDDDGTPDAFAPGSCWAMEQPGAQPATSALELLVDTCGSPSLWAALHAAAAGTATEPELVSAHAEHSAHYEGPSVAVVLPPEEFAELLAAMLQQWRQAAAPPEASVQRLAQAFAQLHAHWSALWSRHAATEEGWPHYRALLGQARQRLARSAALRGTAGAGLAVAFEQWVVRTALQPGLADARHRPRLHVVREDIAPPSFDAPVFVIAAPLAGASVLLSSLAQAEGVHTPGADARALIDAVPALRPEAHGWDSERLDAGDAAADVVAELRRRLAAAARDRDGRAWIPAGGAVRLVEHTPANVLRIPFLAAAFPDARFVVLRRDPLAQVSDMLDAWRAGTMVSHERLPDWGGGRWSLPLTPGWRALEGSSLAEVASAQYQAATTQMAQDLAALPRERWQLVEFDDLVREPAATLARIATFAGLRFDRAPPLLRAPRPASGDRAVSPATPANDEALAPHRDGILAAHALLDVDAQAQHPRPGSGTTDAAPEVESALAADARDAAGDDRARQSGASAPADAARSPAAPADVAPAQPPAAAGARRQALASVHTRSFLEVLQRAGTSLAVSTYQAGKLVLVRREGEHVNTSFKQLRKPMGIARDGARLAIGTASELRQFVDVPDVAARWPGAERPDAVYMPRATHVTGNIDVHEMAYAAGELWIVNTRFGCLCTLDAASSFVPRWKPPFLTALAPEDRCHLNGLAVRDGRVRYVTMLGRSDRAGGWREDKAHGGLLMDLDGERIVCDGLSMPHSPRWYRDRLWVLESGNGGLCRIDPDSGDKHTIAELPGFTRGLDFVGPLAFVGLSQVRESAVFAKLPLTERLRERTCGVWVVNIDSGQTVGFLRFEEAVQEIFAVAALGTARYPELVLADDALVADTFVLPDAALQQVPPAQRVQA